MFFRLFQMSVAGHADHVLKCTDLCVVLVEEVNNPDVIFKGDYLGFGEGFHLWEVDGGGVQSAK